MEKDVLTIVRDELLSLRSRIIANHIAAGQKASGATIESMVVEMTKDGGILYGRFPFKGLETGRKPGRVPANFRQIILQWMQDKGIKATPIPYNRQPSERWTPKYTPQERGDISLAGAIAHKIAEKGTKLYREGGRDDIFSQEIPNTVEAIYSKVTSYFSMEITDINESI